MFRHGTRRAASRTAVGSPPGYPSSGSLLSYT